MPIVLLSTDFDGTLVALDSDPVLHPECMELIGDLQREGALWAINTGRSVELLESGLLDFEFPIHPDFILTSERDVFRPSRKMAAARGNHSAVGTSVVRASTELFNSAQSVLAEVVDFVSQKTKARLIYHSDGLEGLVAASEDEMERITKFIDVARTQQPKFNYQRNTVYLRFCHADYHKGAALAELSRLLEISREEFLQPAITTTTSPCSTASTPSIQPARPTQFLK